METVLFAGIGWVIKLMDFSYADSVFIAPVQHIVSIASCTIAIIVGLPVAIKHIKSFYNTIKTTISKWEKKP